ncbi:hypothetical protein BGW36DRAFT_350767 [Talaromyces proteolyticus]|uniref:Zn(2)-C6 fungal-type domain-containing protein n=1 Tax=Talaromyces proteolyticus TaxID=1131652 RepID=A0AAD4KJM3_9EURO|nr:uncharacterized protein BGW36DRAFT_350767 [Talaromyces proteolyticus]KAH8689839.1 hypothetical protein BGW36DRAFT_350767 [Talaromyces proteolyticus]
MLRPTSTRSIDLVKSRTGCATCRVRKIKCDETRPQCRRCESTGRKCPGYGTSTQRGDIRNSYPILQQPSYGLNYNGQRERRAFEYYFINAAAGIAGALDVSVWKGVVLELCRSEPLVWDAVIALSALYEHPDPFIGPPYVMPTTKSVARHNEALAWYFRSMTNMRTQIEQKRASIFTALVTCVLYVCIEAIQGHTIEAFQLYEQGMGLITALPSQTTSAQIPAIKDLIIPLFFRLGASAIVSANYPVKDPFVFLTSPLDCRFPTIDAARTAIYSLAIESMSLLQAAKSDFHVAIVSSDGVPAIFSRQHALLSKLEQWNHAFADFKEGHLSGVSDPLQQSSLSTLLTFYTALFIMVSTCLSQQEIDYDSHMGQFQLLVKHATDACAAYDDSQCPPFTFEMGPGMPLYVTAVKCRAPELRRKALALLRRVPQIQGFFKCASWAALAEKAIQLEEGDIPVVQSWVLSYGMNVRHALSECRNHKTAGYREVLIFGVFTQEHPIVHDVVVVETCVPKVKPVGGQWLIPEERRLCSIGVTTALKGDAIESIFTDNHGFERLQLRQSAKEHLYIQFRRKEHDPVSGAWKEAIYYLLTNHSEFDQ